MSNSKNKICSYHWSLKWILLISIQLQNTAGNSVQLVSSSIPFETAAYFNTTVDSINNVFISTNLGNVLALLPMVLVTDFYGPTPNFYLSGIGAIITGCLPNTVLLVSHKLINEMFSKLIYDFVLSSSMVPPIYRKIDRRLDTKIFDYKKIKNIYFS